jgi:hypothetical protein
MSRSHTGNFAPTVAPTLDLRLGNPTIFQALFNKGAEIIVKLIPRPVVSVQPSLEVLSWGPVPSSSEQHRAELFRLLTDPQPLV